MIWVPLIVLGGAALLVLWALLMRSVEDITTARRFGWRDLANSYRSPNDFANGPWQRRDRLRMTRQYGKKLAPWHIYLRVESISTPQGLALNYLGRLRPRSKPHEHPVLLLPWSEMSEGSTVVLRGNRQPVVVFTLRQQPKVAIALRTDEAPMIAASSAGQWRIMPPPPA